MSQPITQLNQYRLLGNSGMRVSPICLGTMTFGTEWGFGSDLEESRRILDLYADSPRRGYANVVVTFSIQPISTLAVQARATSGKFSKIGVTSL
jgi:hypothetical protein